MTAIVTLTTYSDADFVAAFIYQQNASPVDLTGSALRMMVRPGSDAGVSEVDISIDSAAVGGITITDAPNGKFQILFSRAQLAKMGVGIYVHSLIRVRPDGYYERIWGGTLTHIIGPTR